MASVITDNIRTEWENWARVPEDTATNLLIVQAAEQIINGKIDGELVATNLDNAGVKIALFTLALWLYNNRDFIEKQNAKAVHKVADMLLAPLTDLCRYIEDTDA